MLPNSLYTANPNSILSNLIAMGHASENYIRNIFNLVIPIQITCDFKVAACLEFSRHLASILAHFVYGGRIQNVREHLFVQ